MEELREHGALDFGLGPILNEIPRRTEPYKPGAQPVTVQFLQSLPIPAVWFKRHRTAFDMSWKCVLKLLLRPIFNNISSTMIYRLRPEITRALRLTIMKTME
ncbi:hypothetical protein PRK78_007420 [Emydomyces testavorans]|uniref:Uncharacterized protein n=1 Tax=Emydomyces testavorans TaxID=2070801 RepID=A0AAF0DN72_9EURO|nr:hypothetical protein PRK78_007420 [Emydomyces testavorans]